MSDSMASPPDDSTRTQGFATIPRSMLHDPGVPRDAKLVYLVLSSHVGGNHSAWPSHRRLADLLGMSVSTVKRQLGWLRAMGYIDWQARIGDNEARITNEYVLLAGSTPSPGKRPSSHRAMGSTGPTPGPHRPTPQSSESDPLAPSDLAEEESLNESHLNEKPISSEVATRRSDVESICGHLADRIEANGSKRPAVTQRWRESARRLLDIDGRTEQQVHSAIDWCQGDEFWRSNILSMPKLREKYDQLRLAAARGQPNGHKPSTTDQRVADALALADRLQRKALA